MAKKLVIPFLDKIFSKSRVCL